MWAPPTHTKVTIMMTFGITLSLTNKVGGPALAALRETVNQWRNGALPERDEQFAVREYQGSSGVVTEFRGERTVGSGKSDALIPESLAS
jgi:hypothetical protein